MTKLQTVATHVVQWDLISPALTKGPSRYWMILSISTVLITNVVSLVIFLVSLGRGETCFLFYSYRVTLGHNSGLIIGVCFCGKDCVHRIHEKLLQCQHRILRSH